MLHPIVHNTILTPLVDILRPVSWRAGAVVSPSDIPANAIYANGEPIPDPSGTGYLTYEV